MTDKNIYLWFYSCHWDWHDSSVSIIYNWKIYSLEVQRLKKVKNTAIKLYINDIDYINDVYFTCNYLLDSINILDDNIDYKFINFVKENSLFSLQKNWKIISPKDNTLVPEHHYLHACSVYYSSLFNDSAIITVDWAWYSQWKSCFECQWIYEWKWNEIIEKYTLQTNNNKWIWIGRAYEYFSNFIWLEEWSVMWLSSYGNAERFKHINIFDFDWISVTLNKNFYIDEVNLDLDSVFWVTNLDYHERSIDITKSIFIDISAKIQKDTEDAMIYLANIAYDIVRSDNLCIAWWVWLNILSNTKILEKTKFKKIFICPATNDTWISLWSAYYWYHVLWWNTKRIPLISAWLWVSYSNDYINNELIKYSEYLDFSKIIDFSKIAELLNNWKIIWWFQWWSEYGPRALWFRSILASPSDIQIRDRVNKIKWREWWRPVAPSIMEEFTSDFFETNFSSPFMALSAKVCLDKIDIIPWVVHIDWTSRYHTVNKIQNERFYNLLNDFYNISWIPVLINTSFNIKWQPILESPKDAIEMFLSTDLDYLVIWEYIVSKNNIYNEFKFNKYKHIFELRYRDEKLVNIIIKKWKLLRKILFNDLVIDEFNYDNWFFIFVYEYENIKYIIFIWKKDWNWAYSTIGNVIVRIYVDGVWIWVLNIWKDISLLLDKISNIINKNYDKLEKIIL